MVHVQVSRRDWWRDNSVGVQQERRSCSVQRTFVVALVSAFVFVSVFLAIFVFAALPLELTFVVAVTFLVLLGFAIAGVLQHRRWNIQVSAGRQHGHRRCIAMR